MKYRTGLHQADQPADPLNSALSVNIAGSHVRSGLRMELVAAGEDMKKLREIARVHIARCEAGDIFGIHLEKSRVGFWAHACDRSFDI